MLRSSLVNPWPTDWPPQINNPLGAPAPRFTYAFHVLYERVTDMIRDTAAPQSHKPAWRYIEIEFFEYLISGFYQEYRKWNDPGAIAAHLHYLHEKAPIAAFELMAHAYLHMAYDLPCTIAQALTDFAKHPPGRSSFTAFRFRFLELEPGFERTADDVASQPGVLGAASFLNRIAPRRWKFSYVFAVWVLRIRSNAYLQAESIFDLPADKTRLERALLAKVIANQREMVRNAYRPLLWFRLLGTPVLFPIFLVVLDQRTLVNALYAITVVVVLMLAYSITSYLLMVQLADELGAATYAAARDAFSELMSRLEPRG
jgi:hypothetical protein